MSELYQDFKVKYKFRTFEEGGRQSPVFQGYRSDFWYYHKDNKENELFMIWPIFEDEKGVKIKAEVEVKTEGVAGMKIINDQLVEYHKLRIAIGTKGYFMEGARRIAECEVIALGKRLSK